MTTAIMRVTHCDFVAALLVVAMLTLGCADSTGPTTGTIEIRISTAGASIDVDPDGYALSIDGEPNRTVGASSVVIFVDLPAGSHLVRLDGLAPNCSVSGTNPRSVEAIAGKAATPVSFSVSCIAKTGSIHVSTGTSGPDPDPDGYSVSVTGVSGGSVPTTGTLTITGIREGPVWVGLSGVSGNCVVEGANPRTVNVTFGAIVEVAFTIRCVAAGRLRVTTATTGTYLDPDGYGLTIYLPGTNTFTHTSVSTNGTVTFSGPVGDYLLTLLEIMPNCNTVLPNPRVVAVTAGSETSVTIDVACDAPREIAFVSVAGANADISIIASNGTGVSRITTQPGSDVDPAWSPDGSRIAFTSERDGNREIYVMNADGTNPVRLTNELAPDFRPAWSPDGARIAFASTRDGNTEIYLMNVNGANPVRLTNNVAYDADPAWSPDGSKIAFASDREGGGIWVMNADGSGVTRLTANIRRDSRPAWSPDGTRIAFSRATPNNNSDIYIINTDGSGLTQLTRGIDNAADPAWSPDGRKIALGSVPSSCGFYDYYCDPHIVVVSTDGIPYSSLTTFASNPAWRP